MTKVSIVGAAGTVGAAAGYNLALRDVVDELVFVDIPDKEEETIGQAADANHGVAYDANTDVVQGDYADTAGSDVVVITAGIPASPARAARTSRATTRPSWRTSARRWPSTTTTS